MRELKAKNPLLTLPFWLVMGGFFICPLILVLLYSFLAPGPYGGITWTFSGEAYGRIFLEKNFDGETVFYAGHIEVILRSLRLAGLCTLLSLAVGFPVAYFMATRPKKEHHFWIFLVTLPFWTNLLIRTYAWILILREDGLVNRALQATGIVDQPPQLLYSDFAVGFGLLYSYLPFMILPLYTSLDRLDWQLVEAGADLYAGRWRTLYRIILPAIAPGVAAGCVLVFVPAVGSFLAADLLGGGKHMMIGNLIGMQFGFSRDWPFGSALSIVIMAPVLLLLVYAARKNKNLAGHA